MAPGIPDKWTRDLIDRVSELEKRNVILEEELIKRYKLCDFGATPCSILLAVANSVAKARKPTG